MSGIGSGCFVNIFVYGDAVWESEGGMGVIFVKLEFIGLGGNGVKGSLLLFKRGLSNDIGALLVFMA